MFPLPKRFTNKSKQVKHNLFHKYLLNTKESALKRYLPEELLAELEGSLMGGGLCFTPFPNTED